MYYGKVFKVIHNTIFELIDRYRLYENTWYFKIFGAINQFLIEQGSFIGDITLFLSIQGVGGCFNCMFVLISSSLPIGNVGSGATLINTFAITAALGVPLIVLLKQPYPFIILCCLLIICIIVSSSSVIKDGSRQDEYHE